MTLVAEIKRFLATHAPDPDSAVLASTIGLALGLSSHQVSQAIAQNYAQAYSEPPRIRRRHDKALRRDRYYVVQ